MMRWALDELEEAYQNPVDIEYAIDILPGSPNLPTGSLCFNAARSASGISARA
jgi:hypothetical protein